MTPFGPLLDPFWDPFLTPFWPYGLPGRQGPRLKAEMACICGVPQRVQKGAKKGVQKGVLFGTPF